VAATIQGGATAADVASAVAPHGMVAAPLALTVEGGYGPLTPRCGLALDLLFAAEVVFAGGAARRLPRIRSPGSTNRV